MGKSGFKCARRQPPTTSHFTGPWGVSLTVQRALQRGGEGWGERRKGKQTQEKGQGAGSAKGPAWLVCGVLHGGEQAASPLTQPSSLLPSLLEPSTFSGYPAKERRPGAHHAYHVWVHYSLKQSQFKKQRLPAQEERGKAGLLSSQHTWNKS